jgi:hypothetical protein
MLRNGDVALAAPFTVLVSALLLQAQQPGGVGFHSVELERWYLAVRSFVFEILLSARTLNSLTLVA